MLEAIGIFIGCVVGLIFWSVVLFIFGYILYTMCSIGFLFFRWYEVGAPARKARSDKQQWAAQRQRMADELKSKQVKAEQEAKKRSKKEPIRLVD